jgi:host factor-I protein
LPGQDGKLAVHDHADGGRSAKTATSLPVGGGDARTTAGPGRKQQEGICPMSAEKSQNVQDVFLNHIRKNKVPVTIFLINGVKLQGVVSSFDNFSLLLRRDGHVQLVYKHAVSTVMPATVVRLYEPSTEEAAPAEVSAR